MKKSEMKDINFTDAKKIGSCNGNDVIYGYEMVHIVGTEIYIFNVKSELDAIKAMQRNFKNYIVLVH